MISTRKKIKPPILFLLLIALSLEYAFGQDVLFKSLTVKNGLSNSYVNCMLQDRTGFIWFGTDDGLNRYDGYNVKVFRNIPGDSSSLSDNIIWAIFEDKEGYLWIGTKGGILDRYSPYTDEFKHWYLDSTETEGANITFITEDSNNFLWLGTYRNGVYRFDPSQNNLTQWVNTSEEQLMLSSNFIMSILEDNYSTVWVSTYYGLNKFNPDSDKRPFEITENPLFNEPLWYLGKSSFYKNSIWIGKLNGLINFNPQTQKCNQIDLPESFDLQYGNSVSSVVEENFAEEKILWVGTYGGLVRLNLTTAFNERFVLNKSKPSGMLSNQVNDLLIDRSGVVWVATDNGLIYYSRKMAKFNFPVGQNISSLNYPEIKNGNVRSVVQSQNNSFWFGTEKGLFGLNINNGKSSLLRNSKLEELNVWSMNVGNSDNLWIGTYGQGLKELDLKTNHIKSWKVENPDFYPSPYYYVKAILQDNKGMVWVGFWGGGLARMNPSTGEIKYWRHQPEIEGSLSYNDIWALHQDKKGRIWVGTNGGGLNLFNEEKNNFTTWKNNTSAESVLSSNSIYTFHESSDEKDSAKKTVLWIGTSSGLNKFVIYENQQGISDSGLTIENAVYSVEKGLPDNSIESILEDETGNLWIGTSSGISQFNIETESFTNFNAADGLNRGASNSNAAITSNDGIMFFGSTAGINVFDPKRVLQSNYSPPVVITDFQIFNQPEDDGNSPLNESITYAKNINLNYNQNDFSFQFASLDYNAPEDIQYAYMLEGFDEEWIYCGTRRFITYTNLDAGKYLFRVKATNSDGVWNEEGTSLAIVINPPFWMTWWAYSIYAVLFITVLISIRAFETKRRTKKEEEKLRREREAALLREAKLKAITIEQEKELEKQKIRNRIAQDLHDEIGSNLSSISLMSELIQKDGKINTEALGKINRIQKVAKGSSQAMRDIVWLTNPSSDSIKDLVSKMNEVANDMLGNMKWHFNFPKNLSEVNLIPEIKRNVFFIFKESLNNILKHANAQKVNIDLKVIDKKIFLTIKDDGHGFDASTIYSGNGLKNLHSRANEIKGGLSIESSPKNGTTINLLVNITQIRD